jgi:pimeloyl-ACP methyl ester carboxylesterase
MPVAMINGINLSFDDYGSGEPVLLIGGSGARGGIWKTHQVPALTRMGFRVITVDSRGVPPSDICEEGFSIHDMVADTVALIKYLEIEPCRVVGTSLGAVVTQEAVLSHPGLFKQAVMMATRGRNDVLSAAASAAEVELFDSGVKLPPRYEAVQRVMLGFSRRTLQDEQVVRDWLDLFEMSPASSSLSKSQLLLDIMPNRLTDYRGIAVPSLILAFADDLITPPAACREVADHIPGSVYKEIAECGHYGYLEDPGAVNGSIIEFFRGGKP